MHLLDRWLWHRAASAYARRLGPRLTSDYGGETPYTAGQVQTAVRQLHLNARYIALGYAVFGDPADYDELAKTAPKRIDPGIARVIFDRYKPWAHTADDDDWGDPKNIGGVGVSGTIAGVIAGGGPT